MTRSKADVDLVLGLLAKGVSEAEVSRRTGVPWSTVRNWRTGRARTGARRAGPCAPCNGDAGSIPAVDYAYLLGLSLGDGFLARHRRGVYRLCIACDTSYPALIRTCEAAMAAVLPASKVGSLQRVGSKYVTSYSTHWPCYFPQHGPGKKHERAIVLERWQEGLVDDEPRAFLRGLLHSDGCRVVNRVAGREYSRYMFTNYSQDIRRCSRRCAMASASSGGQWA